MRQFTMLCLITVMVQLTWKESQSSKRSTPRLSKQQDLVLSSQLELGRKYLARDSTCHSGQVQHWIQFNLLQPIKRFWVRSWRLECQQWLSSMGTQLLEASSWAWHTISESWQATVRRRYSCPKSTSDSICQKVTMLLSVLRWPRNLSVNWRLELHGRPKKH